MHTLTRGVVATAAVAALLIAVATAADTTSSSELVSAATPCVFQGFDLSSIGTQTLSIQQSYKGGLTAYNWVLNFCQPANSPPNGATSCAVSGFISEYSTKSCETAWNQMTGNSAISNGVQLDFAQQGTANHVGWTAVVSITCGSTPLASTGNVMVTGASTSALNFAFTLTSSAVCSGPPPPPTPPTPQPPTPGTPTPGAPPTPAPQGGVAPAPSSSGCGGGCAFVIIFFVGGFVYVAATVAFYYFRQGKRGLELLPHTSFWKEFAGCTKDGVVFSVQKIRALVCKSGPYVSTGYQAV